MHILLEVVFIFSLSVAHAQDLSCFKNICLSPPLPPTFNPVNTNTIPQSRSGNNYNIPFDTITFNPTLGTSGFDIVICVDGVINNAQIALADNYIDSLVTSLQLVAHYQPRFKYFNIYRIAKLSNEQGSAWGFTGDTTVDNRYGSRFNAFNLDRLLIPEKVDTLFADVSEFVPAYDLVLMLTFDKKYGGSGWTLFDGRKVASFSIDEETGWHLGDEVIIHEMQHIMPFAGHGYLGDEYEDSNSCVIYDSIPASPNFTSDTINNRKWEHCLGLPNVGFYPEAGICPGNFRPTPICIMAQVFQFPPFCPVCRENSTAYFDSLINPVHYASPSPASFTGSYTFLARIDTPLVNTFRYQWTLDDSLLATGVDSITLNLNLLTHTENHILKFICTDTDAHIIDTTLRRPWTTVWNLLTKDTALSISGLNEETIVKLFPNPVTDVLHGTITGNQKNISIDIITVDGRVLMKNIPVRENGFDLNVSSLSAGVYFLIIKGNTFSRNISFYKHLE